MKEKEENTSYRLPIAYNVVGQLCMHSVQNACYHEYHSNFYKATCVVLELKRKKTLVNYI